MSLSMLSCYLLVISSYPDTLQKWLLDVGIKRKRQGRAHVLSSSRSRWRALFPPSLGKRRSHAVLVLRGLCTESCFSLFYFFHAICVAKHLLFVWLKCQTPPRESKPAQPILQMTTRANWCEWAFLRRCRSPASTEPEFPGCASILSNSPQWNWHRPISKWWGAAKGVQEDDPWVLCQWPSFLWALSLMWV